MLLSIFPFHLSREIHHAVMSTWVSTRKLDASLLLRRDINNSIKQIHNGSVIIKKKNDAIDSISNWTWDVCNFVYSTRIFQSSDSSLTWWYLTDCCVRRRTEKRSPDLNGTMGIEKGEKQQIGSTMDDMKAQHPRTDRPFIHWDSTGRDNKCVRRDWADCRTIIESVCPLSTLCHLLIDSLLVQQQLS